MTLRTLQRFDNDIMWYNFYAFLSIDFLYFNLFSVCSQINFFFFFWNSLHKGLKRKKEFLIFRHFFRGSFNFYVGLFIFEEIFCWIAWVTFRWIAVLFSFHLDSHRTNYVSNEYKKELKTSHWLNNICLWLISRSDFLLKVAARNCIKKDRQRNSLIHKT